MFPDRAPSDQYLYTTFVGGSRNKDLARASVYVLFYFILILDLHSEMENEWNLHSSTENLSFFSINFYSDELKEIVTSDLRKLLGADGQPTFVK